MVTKEKTSKGAAALKAALEGKAAAPAPAAPVTEENKNGAARERGYRGVNISAHFDKSVQRQLKMIMLQTDKTQRVLIAEAFDMLFAKYKLPQIALAEIVEPEQASA